MLNPRTQSGAHRGLVLPRRALRRLAEAGIFAQASVSLEYQQLAKRYVVRGVESGGAVEGLGRYVTFCGDQGEPIHGFTRWMGSESTASMLSWLLRR